MVLAFVSHDAYFVDELYIRVENMGQRILIVLTIVLSCFSYIISMFMPVLANNGVAAPRSRGFDVFMDCLFPSQLHPLPFLFNFAALPNFTFFFAIMVFPYKKIASLILSAASALGAMLIPPLYFIAIHPNLSHSKLASGYYYWLLSFLLACCSSFLKGRLRVPKS